MKRRPFSGTHGAEYGKMMTALQEKDVRSPAKTGLRAPGAALSCAIFVQSGSASGSARIHQNILNTITTKKVT